MRNEVVIMIMESYDLFWRFFFFCYEISAMSRLHVRNRVFNLGSSHEPSLDAKNVF